MLAVVTGASSGIGRDIARELAGRGFDLVLVARNRQKLLELAETLPVHSKILSLDLSRRENCYLLHDLLKGKRVDVFVNNAGFGQFGAFSDTDLSEELGMIELNIESVHILTKLFLQDFIRRDHGMILNVASSAAFMAGGPLMATYYASKAYVLKLSQAIYEELRRRRSRVSISVLCPGPVNTNFNNRANVQFTIPGLSSERVARVAVDQMLKRKLVIVPGGVMKSARLASKWTPDRLLLAITYYMQRRKTDAS